ncbi:hypothetical protein C8J56DRAFT_915358 [Mycena floridula]|nr:hypothetical protein C8J56DRAFT_915358 [Mycena floridula]
MHIVVLGGGLTGLSSAFHLSRRFPKAMLTVLEQKNRLGGWVNSTRVTIPGSSATVVLEDGPRTLRPNAKSVLELIHLLKLRDSVITVPQTAPAAKRRFLHLPGSTGLVEIPSSPLAVLASPLRSILLKAVLLEPFRRANRNTTVSDESLDSFLSRRFGQDFARIFGSALVHGIYAADSRMLSIRSAFPSVWNAEERGRGSVVWGFLRPGRAKTDQSSYELGEVLQMMDGVSVFSFKDGMNTLTDALASHLEAMPNVNILSDAAVKSVRPLEDKLEVTTVQNILNPTHIVSALPLATLESLLPPSASLPHLKANSSSSVTVVNMVFRVSRTSRPFPDGFGYLIPRSNEANLSGIIGTVFDSCALEKQDTDANDFFKLTVMTKVENPEIRDLLQNLSRHLDYQLEEPVYTRITRNVACIPVPTPGHLERMAEMKTIAESDPWRGRIQIVGAGVGGVSVGDCVEAGRQVGHNWQ